GRPARPSVRASRPAPRRPARRPAHPRRGSDRATRHPIARRRSQPRTASEVLTPPVLWFLLPRVVAPSPFRPRFLRVVARGRPANLTFQEIARISSRILRRADRSSASHGGQKPF